MAALLLGARDAGGRGNTGPRTEPLQLDEDTPGQYIVIHDGVAVSSGLSTVSPITQILAFGTVVNVLEVARIEEDKRVRGRIEDPPGWVSLLDTGDGYRWARRQAPAPGPPPGDAAGLSEPQRTRLTLRPPPSGRLGLRMSEELEVTGLAGPEAAEGGWREGDRVLAVNGSAVEGKGAFLAELGRALARSQEDAGAPMVFDVVRPPGATGGS